jgi:hypothetical protein
VSRNNEGLFREMYRRDEERETRGWIDPDPEDSTEGGEQRGR